MTNSDRASTPLSDPAADSSSSRARVSFRPSLPLVVFGALVIFVAAVLFAAMPAPAQLLPDNAPAGHEVELNRIVLRVNDQILTLHEFERRKAMQIERVLANPNLDPEVRKSQLSQIGKGVIKGAFDEMLLLARARQMSIVVDEDQITAAIDQVREGQGLASDEAFQQALSVSNMTMEQLRADYRRELTMSELVNREVQDRIDISEDALRAFYRENSERFRQAEKRQIEEIIVFAASGLDDAQMAQVAQTIIDSVKGGASLSEASASYRDEGIVSEPIDLGWLEREEIGAELRQAAFAAEAGAVAGPIEARGGLHVLRVVEVEEGRARAFADVQPELRREVRGRGYGREMRKYMAELEDRAHVVENLPADAVGFRSIGADREVEQDILDLFRAQELPAPKVDLDADQDA